MSPERPSFVRRDRSLIPDIVLDMAAKANLTSIEFQTLMLLCRKLFPEDRVRKWIAEHPRQP